jgi:uncharacterized protein DUF6894
MHCYFNLVSPHQTIIDEEGIAVADAEEARTFAREAISEMVQDGVAEIAHWRGWEIEARDASGTVLFTLGFDALLSAEGERADGVAVSLSDNRTYAYDQAA